MSSPELLLESRIRTWDTLALIQNPNAPGVGQVVSIEAHPETLHDDFTGRWHQHFLIGYEGHMHSVLVTNPVTTQSETDIVFFPGFTQTVDEVGGTGFKFHTELAARRPHERMISISSTGIGRFGDRIKSDDQATMEGMAAQRFGLLEAISGDRPKVIVPLSMGTVVANRLIQLDLDRDMRLNIKGIANYVPALVLPEEVGRRMKRDFVGHVLPDARRELFDARNLRHPSRIVDMGLTVLHLGLGPADAHALRVQMASLGQGTRLEAFQAETENYHTATTTGSRDPLRQEATWGAEAERHPANVHFRVIQGRGHGMALDSVGAAVHIDHQIDRYKFAA